MILISTGVIISIIVTVVLIGAIIALYIVGNKMQKKQMEQREQINAASQAATLFIIDKKIMPMKDAGLPNQLWSRHQSVIRKLSFLL